jgi:hypothetical protein
MPSGIFGGCQQSQTIPEKPKVCAVDADYHAGGTFVANPVSSVSSSLQSAHIAQKGPVRDATPNPTPQQHAIHQDTVSISKSGAAASQAQAASKSAQGSNESESGEAK